MGGFLSLLKLWAINTGAIYSTIKALNHTEAFNKCLEKNINVLEDYFLQDQKETNASKKLNLKGRTILQMNTDSLLKQLKQGNK